MKIIVEYSFTNFDNFDPEHNTVLHYGAKGGNVELCRYLVERVGVSPKAGNLHRITPFDVAHGISVRQKAGRQIQYARP